MVYQIIHCTPGGSEMCIPAAHISLVICVSPVGIHKTLRAKYPGPQRQSNDIS